MNAARFAPLHCRLALLVPGFGLCIALCIASCAKAPPENPLDAAANASAASVDGKPATTAQRSAKAVEVAVAAKDRPPADRIHDLELKAAAVLAFVGVQPGQRVLELMGGDGYYTEILAHVVGRKGRVFATRVLDNTRFERLTNATWTSTMAAEMPQGSVDLAFTALHYHEIIGEDIDRPALFANVYNAMKPNATLVVSDYSAVPGVGFRFAPRLHRIDEAALCKELAAAGFELVASSDLLRNPADSRMTDPVRMAGKTDQFLLKFKRSNKPVSAALMTDNRIVQTGPLDTKGGDETKAVATAASAP